MAFAWLRALLNFVRRRMDYKLAIEQKPTYLHVTVTGSNTRENGAAYLHEILEECKARHCFRVLIEDWLEGPRFNVMDVFIIVSHGAIEALGIIEAVAYVYTNADRRVMKFAESVAVNRLLHAAVFSNVADAEKWLLRQP
jgi:hypothetical protein